MLGAVATRTFIYLLIVIRVGRLRKLAAAALVGAMGFIPSDEVPVPLSTQKVMVSMSLCVSKEAQKASFRRTASKPY